MPAPTAVQSPSIHLLGPNGYSVWLTATGAGRSLWHGLAVTRWQPAAACEQGTYVYLRDIASGEAWSATAAPMGGRTRHWRDAGMVRFARTDQRFLTTLEVAIDPERALEVRGIGLCNRGDAARDIELTSYVELALNDVRADAVHPAYSKMFVETFLVDGVLLAHRRKKDAAEPDIWAAHALVVEGSEAVPREWETDRMRFIGRDGSLARPDALAGGHALSGTVGTVLDPVFSLRTRVRVAAGATRRVAFVTAAGASRAEVLATLRGQLAPAACAAVFARADAATTKAGSVDDRRVAERLAGALVYDDRALRPAADILARGEGGAPVLWAKGISGDLPIVVMRVGGASQIANVQRLLTAQRFWRARQLPADVVLINAAAGAAADALDAALQAASAAAGVTDKAHGSIFMLRGAGLDARLRAGLLTAARAVLDGGKAPMMAAPGADAGVRVAPPRRQRVAAGVPAAAPAAAELESWNGIGGFAQPSGDYITLLRAGVHTPAPWAHLVANAGFGFLVTATGGGYCWAGNSQQNQITAWSNDAVCDPPGDAFLLRNMDDGAEWSATASPTRIEGATYVARFGPGYARFDASVHGIESTLIECVAPDDPVKLARVRLHNSGHRRRRVALAHVVAWTLGPIGSEPRPTTRIDADAAHAAAFADNPWRDEFTQAVAFSACSAKAAVRVDAANTRSALVATLELEADATVDVLFVLGEGADRDAAKALAERWRQTDFDAALANVVATWASVLDPLQIETPVHSLDLLVNRWLPYQVLACRLWARTAFYQASGAYGFRDQLQDVAALCIARPDLARAHILLSASRQFEEGDVQHWWLPPSGKGVRTRIVDDRLWLPYVVAHYVTVTGDASVLDVRVPFLRGDPLQPGQNDAFYAPTPAATDGTLFEHCARAIEVSLGIGVHGLPLMGTGDWNDGMNRVGAGGKGESVWMGWFLSKVIADFAPFAEQRGDARAARWRDHARRLELALETKAWDGAWYRRAFYDDGTPLGSAADEECCIESMAQSWAVISGRGDAARAAQAMRAVAERLVRRDDSLVALFTPPFDKTTHDPGYIKGYPPGLRENGGQYTHGSVWSLIAFALLGEGERVGELLEIFDPVRHADSAEKLARYKVEPYVQCADVYSVAPHAGRGGWTWYSGSAGWTYRAIVERVLGFQLEGGRLHLAPCIPPDWPGFAMTYRRGRTTWRIEVANRAHASRGVASIEVDGVTLRDNAAGIVLVDDGTVHHVNVTLQ